MTLAAGVAVLPAASRIAINGFLSVRRANSGVRARPSVQRELFDLLLRNRLKGSRIISVQRPPTAYLLPVVAPTEIRQFRPRGSF
jgi:hypothetical protein